MRIIFYTAFLITIAAFFYLSLRLFKLLRIERLLVAEDPSLKEDPEKAVFKLLSERQDLKSRLKSLTEILEKLPVGLIIFSKDFKIIYTNRFANKVFLLGLEKKGKSSVLAPMEKSLELTSLLKEALKRGERSFEFGDKDTKKSFKITAHFVEFSEKSGDRLPIAIIEDITVEKRLEDFKKYLVSDLSHQLKTPITSMKIALEALGDYKLLNDSEKVIKLVNNLKQDIERMNQLVEKIILLSKIESVSKNELRMEKFNLCGAVEESLKRVENMALEKEVEFVLKGDCPEVIADKGLIEEAIACLIENAVKFSEKKSSVVIEAGESPEGVFLSVTNYGSLIDEEEMPFIFQRFYRSKKQKIQSREGFGLGLSLVKNILEIHGGRVEVSSSEKSGTTFTIFLPTQNF